MGQIEDLQKQIDEMEAQIAQFRSEGQDPSPVIFAREMFEGRLAALQGNVLAAEAAYRKSVEGFQKLEMDKEAATVALEAARFLIEKNSLDKAFSFCQAAVQAVDLLWWKTPLSNRLRVSPIAVEAYDLAIQVAYAQQNYARVFDWIQLAKSRWLNDVILLKQAAQQFPSPQSIADQGKWETELIARRGNFQAAAARLDASWNSYLAGHTGENELRQAEQQALQAYSPLVKLAFGPLRPIAATFAVPDIQSRLNPREALLEIYVQSDGIYTLLLKPDQFKPFYQPIDAQEVQARVLSTYLALIQSESRRGFKKQIQGLPGQDKQDLMQQIGRILYPDPLKQLQAFYDLLLKPLKEDIDDVRRLIICPHWGLHVIPFHALGPSVEKGDLLAQSKVITYCPSATIWGRLRDAEREHRPAAGTNNLIVGVEKKTGSEWAQRVDDFIKHLRGDVHLSDFEGEAVDIAQDVKTRPVLGSTATKTRVLADFPNAEIIHLSCHSVLDRPTPTLNGLLLADGVLTIAEILTDEQIGSAQPSLISISACRSEMGRVEPGDTFWGVGYALLARCSGRILSSLWPVDAEATRVLMDKFYAEHEHTVDWAESLRCAQLATRQASSHAGTSGGAVSFADPYFWAGFRIIGS